MERPSFDPFVGGWRALAFTGSDTSKPFVFPEIPEDGEICVHFSAEKPTYGQFIIRSEDSGSRMLDVGIPTAHLHVVSCIAMPRPQKVVLSRVGPENQLPISAICVDYMAGGRAYQAVYDAKD